MLFEKQTSGSQAFTSESARRTSRLDTNARTIDAGDQRRAAAAADEQHARSNDRGPGAQE